MRDLINEICAWAVKRLKDESWWKIGQGLVIQNEIQDFRGRIAETRALFKDLSLVNQAKGFDFIIRYLQYYFKQQEKHQRVVLAHIEKIRQTQEEQSDRVIDEITLQRQIAERERFLAQTLNLHTVADPTYDSQGKQPCDEDTRLEVLKEIRRWKDDTSSGSPNFLWLTGDPGCGKSAVTASLARECKDQRTLWAQFFINRNNVETTNPKAYFPSIARQLASRSPDIADAIHQTLSQQLSLLDDISAIQAAKLFTESVRQASQLDPDQPLVIIIDGLDETNRARLEFTAKTFATLFTTLEAYSNVKVFISSRTENEIQKSFFRPSNDKHVKRMHLNTADPSSFQDVSHYIKRNLLNLVIEHDLNWDVWPGDERTRALGERASGLFIWGVTAIKFIEDQLQSHGEECLDDVLNMLTADVLHDINSLYRLILKVTVGREQDEWEVERFRRIVGAIVCLQEPLCLDDLATLLDLRKTPSSKRADLTHFVRRFRTILVSGTDTITGATIPRIHKSVFEFVTSNSIDVDFRVELGDAHLELGLQCLNYLGTARLEPPRVHSLPLNFCYASRFWSSHLSQAKITGRASVCAYDIPSPLSVQYDQLSLQSIGSVHDPMHIRCSATEITTATTYSLIWDAISGVSLSPHKSKVTCIVFSPDGKQVASCSLDGTIQRWDCGTAGWLGTLVKYSSPVLTIAFSPDGKLLISGSEDGLVHLWEYPTGDPVGNPFQGHDAPINCVAFPPHGDLVASACGHGVCIIWNGRTGEAIGKPLITDPGIAVRHVAFSMSGHRLCTVGDNRRCIVWDINSRQMIGDWSSDNRPLNCVAFSPKDDDIVAVGGGDGVQIVQSCQQKQSIPDFHFYARCLSFSPDGRELVFACNDLISTAEVKLGWEYEPDVHNFAYAEGNIDARSMALSPTLEFFAYSDSTDKIYIFPMPWAPTKINPFPGGAHIELRDGEDRELIATLLDMNTDRRDYTTAVTSNNRLNTIKWFKRDISAVVESNIRICVVNETAIIVGYKDGSVVVWEHRTVGMWK